jgi:hypothetical protein
MRLKLTYPQRAQLQRNAEKRAARRVAFKLLCEIPIDQLTPEQTRQRFYYDRRGDILYWRDSMGGKRKAGEVLKVKGVQYPRQQIIDKYLDGAPEMRVIVPNPPYDLLRQHMQDAARRNDDHQQRLQRLADTTAERIEREKAELEYARKYVFFKPMDKPSDTSQETLDFLASLSAKAKEKC